MCGAAGRISQKSHHQHLLDKQEEKASKSTPKPDDKKMSPPPAGEDTDILEFTSATEGEGSSSAWELVPEKKIARKDRREERFRT